MSIGVLSGTAQNGQKIEVVFESYYQAAEQNELSTYVSERMGVSSLVNSISSQLSNQTDKSKILTFDNFQREGDGRWAVHEIIGQDKKPILEYIGPGLESISFSIFLLASLGVNPLQELQNLRQLRDDGIICDFIIGIDAISKNQWVVTKLSEAHKYFDGKGALIGASVTVNLNEYIKLPKEA